MTDNSPRLWHSNSDPRLRDSFDTVNAHEIRVMRLCHELAAYLGHPLTDSDLLTAARHHDEAERVLGDMPGPAKDMFPDLRDAYFYAECEVMSDMGLRWCLTGKEKTMLHLCDKLDAYQWASKHTDIETQEWRHARSVLYRLAIGLGCREWLKRELG